MEPQNKKMGRQEAVNEASTQSIGTLQKQAADALNNLFARIVEEKYRAVFWTHFIALAFKIESDDKAGYKFIPTDIEGKDSLKYQNPEPDEADDNTGVTTYKPSPPTFRDVSRDCHKKAKTVSSGVRK